MELKNLFVSYDIALQLKEKGFDEICLGHYYERNQKKCLVIYGEFVPDTSKWLNAPLYQHVIDWFREIHKVEIISESGPDDLGYSYTIYYQENSKPRVKQGMGHHMEVEVEWNYYQALIEAIREALKLI